MLKRYRWWIADHPWRWAGAFGFVSGAMGLGLSLALGAGFGEALAYAATAAGVTWLAGGAIRSSRFYRNRERTRLRSP
jgi:hypothetical protein